MLTPLVLSFYDWSTKALGDHSKKESNRNLYAHFESVSSSWISHRIEILKMSYDFKDLNQLNALNHYNSWADDCPSITNEEDLTKAVESWESLMIEHTWEEIIPGQPRIANLYHITKHGAPHLLPYTLILNGEPFYRIFGHYYVSKAYLNSKGAKAFFDYLAKTDRLEDLYDLEHKEKITKLLLDPILQKSQSGQKTSILDVGCGDGFVGEIVNKDERFKGSELFGIDVSAEKFPYLEQKGLYKKVAQLNIANTKEKKLLRKLQNNGFTDIVLAFVDFWLSPEERKSAYKLVYELLPKGGILAFDVHHPDEILSEPNYRRILGEAGFKNISFAIKKVPANDGGVRKVGIVFAIK